MNTPIIRPFVKFGLPVALLGLWLSTASAVTTSYNLTFIGGAVGIGSGSATFDDIQDGTFGIFPRYDFSNVSGTGAVGDWNLPAFGETFYGYRPSDGQSVLKFGPLTTLLTFATGLTPTAALEASFEYIRGVGLLNWSVAPTTGGPTGVADGGSTLGLLSLGLLAIGAGRKLMR